MDARKNFNIPSDAGRYSQFVPGRPQEFYLPGEYEQQIQQHQQLYNLMYDTDYTQDCNQVHGRMVDENMYSPSDITPTETQPFGIHHTLYYDQMMQDQSQNDRVYHFNSGRTNQNTATSRLKHQYQQLQEEKMRLQIQTQNDAFLQQQQTFALRQQLNPPVPPSYPQSPTSIASQISFNQLQQNKIPPQNLNLSGHYAYSPENKTEKNDFQSTIDFHNQKDPVGLAFKQNLLIQQQKQTKQQHHNLGLQSPTSHQVIIQQNHPSKVVNQAVQTQMSDTSQKSSSSTSNTPQSPSHSILERRKSESLKSPIIKRMEGAPISLSGFLNKQGSDGLKVWKKRYFVLSEYCLFYYKGPEQEKLLGSVLLPSYTITACTPEDKVYRKYAFKCEHTNMRTYVLAADTQESMEKWMKALTMAAAMQDSTINSSQSVNQSYNEPGMQHYQSLQGQYGPVTTVNEKQPLYINAPPKPSRKVSGDIGHSSPTSPDHVVYSIYDAPRVTHNFVDTQAIYGLRNDSVTTNVVKNESNPTLIQQKYSNAHSNARQNFNPYNGQNQQTIERRTPDQYIAHRYTANKYNYEDIYGLNKHNNEQLHIPASPTKNQPLVCQNVSDGIYQCFMTLKNKVLIFIFYQLSPTKVQMRDKVSVQTVPRPHSADFLDFENKVQSIPYEQSRAPRPKSSLDINRALDNYYYSEASYAEQMRTESANYVPKQSYRCKFFFFFCFARFIW